MGGNLSEQTPVEMHWETGWPQRAVKPVPTHAVWPQPPRTSQWVPALSEAVEGERWELGCRVLPVFRARLGAGGGQNRTVKKSPPPTGADLPHGRLRVTCPSPSRAPMKAIGW